MKKTTSALLALIMLLMFALTLVPVQAYDERYYSFTADHYGGNIGGNWNTFYSTTSHSYTHYALWRNEYASEMDEWSGFEHGWLRLELHTSMHDGGTKWVKMSIYADPASSWCGGLMKIEVGSLNWDADVYCTFLDGSSVEHFEVSDWRNYYFAIETRFALSNQQVSGERDFIFAVKYWRITKSSGYMYLLTEKGGFASESFATKGDFCHKVEAHYGYTTPSTGTWNALFDMYDIGARPDLANADCLIDIHDIVVVTGNYGEYLGGDGLTWDEWMWETDCWKADVDRSLSIDIYDVVYLTSQYGRSW